MNNFIFGSTRGIKSQKAAFLQGKYNLTFVNASTIKTFLSLSLKDNQQDATFPRSIYFYKFLYMFQAVPPPIIRSTKLYIQRQVLSNQYCCLLLSWMRWNSMEFYLSVHRKYVSTVQATRYNVFSIYLFL